MDELALDESSTEPVSKIANETRGSLEVFKGYPFRKVMTSSSLWFAILICSQYAATKNMQMIKLYPYFDKREQQELQAMNGVKTTDCLRKEKRVEKQQKMPWQGAAEAFRIDSISSHHQFTRE